MAARRCPYTTGETVFHSDRGCQYTSEQLAQHLGRYEINASTGRTGVCWAGAWAEVGGCDPQGTRGSIRWSTTARSKTIRDTASQVEPGTHDQKQLHSALGHRTQGEADQEHRAARQAARDTAFRAVRDTPGSPVQAIQATGTTTVHNLHVPATNNYHVHTTTNQPILVHNDTGPKKKGLDPCDTPSAGDVKPSEEPTIFDSRNAAFRAAKRDARIPAGEQPSSVAMAGIKQDRCVAVRLGGARSRSRRCGW